MKKYIVKKRTKDHVQTGNPYRPRGQWTYGKWATVSKHGTFEEAQDAGAMIPGTTFTDVAIFRGGKRID